MKSLFLIIIIAFFSFVRLDAYETRCKTVNQSHIKIENLNMVFSFALLSHLSKSKAYFFDDKPSNKLFRYGYIGFPCRNNELKLVLLDLKNKKGVSGSKKSFYITVRNYKCYISENKDQWYPLTLTFNEEQSYPGGHPEYEKIWIINLDSKLFSGEYVLPIDNEDFPVVEE
jgi:hypothetical protein